MVSELIGIGLCIAMTVGLAAVTILLSKLLSVLSDRMLPDEKE